MLSRLHRRQTSLFICVSCVAFLLKCLAWLPIVYRIRSEPLSLGFTAVCSSIQPGFPLLQEEWYQEKAWLSKAILGSVRPEWDGFSRVEGVLAATDPGGAESPRQVIEAGTEVQLPDLSKMWGLGFRSTAETLSDMQGHKGWEHLVARLKMPVLELLHKCP